MVSSKVSSEASISTASLQRIQGSRVKAYTNPYTMVYPVIATFPPRIRLKDTHHGNPVQLTTSHSWGFNLRLCFFDSAPPQGRLRSFITIQHFNHALRPHQERFFYHNSCHYITSFIFDEREGEIWSWFCFSHRLCTWTVYSLSSA